MATEALCDGCGRSWKVPDASRTYKCRDCGGKVAVASAVPEPAAPDPAPPPANDPRKAKTIQRPGVAALAMESDGEKPKARRGNSNMVKYLIIGGVVVVMVVVLVLLTTGAGPLTLEVRLAAFQQTWASGSLDDLKPYFDRDYVRVSWKDRMEETFANRDWLESRPELTEFRIDERDATRARVMFTLMGGTLQTSWISRNDVWVCADRTRIPKWVMKEDPPSSESKAKLEDRLELFRSAWNEKRWADVQEMVGKEKRLKAWYKNLDEYGVKNEGRIPLKPGPEIKFSNRALVLVVFEGADGVVRNSWRKHAGEWMLTGIAFK